MEPLMRYIARTSRCASIYRGKAFNKLEINEYQHPYIICICQNPGINQEQISNEIFVNKSNVTRQLTALEQKKLIYRIPSITDKRVVNVYPTEKAIQILPKIKTVLKEWNEKIIEDLTENEKESILLIMKKVQAKAFQAVEL